LTPVPVLPVLELVSEELADIVLSTAAAAIDKQKSSGFTKTFFLGEDSKI
jgi:hypothetical protein